MIRNPVKAYSPPLPRVSLGQQQQPYGRITHCHHPLTFFPIEKGRYLYLIMCMICRFIVTKKRMNLRMKGEESEFRCCGSLLFKKVHGHC